MTNDTKMTVLGMITAVGVALGDFFANLGADGLNVQSPTFWIGLVIAACLGLKGYFSNKPDRSATTPEPPPTP